MGMNVNETDSMDDQAELQVDLHPDHGATLKVEINTIEVNELMAEADIISVHIPGGQDAVLGEEEIAKMKKGVILINAARGGVIDEDALLAGLESGQIAAAGLDVFTNEPTPRKELINHPKISVSHHIGASTQQDRNSVGIELAEKITEALSK